MDELIASRPAEVVPYQEEAVAILANWLGRSEQADARPTIDKTRLTFAIQVFRQCADGGSAGANLVVGAFDSEDSTVSVIEKARAHFEFSASHGVSIANLGSAAIAYRLGEPDIAEQSLRKLQEFDKRFDSELIGLMLLKGIVFRESGKNAMPWLVRAATEDNSATAQHTLFDMYSKGAGVPKSDVEARKWKELLDQNPRGQREWGVEKDLVDEITHNP